MKARARFKVKKFTNSSGTVSFRVDGYKVDGSRVRANYASEEAAAAERTRLEIEAANIETATSLRPTRLSEAQLAEAERAFVELPEGRSLLGAVRWFVENYREPIRQKSTQAAFAEFMESKVAEGCRDRTLGNLRSRVGLLAKAFGDKLVSDVQPEHVRELVYRPGRAPQSAANDRRALSSFFSWCQQRDFTSTNPVAKVPVPKWDREEPAILTNEQTEKLLAMAAAHREGRLLPYTVLALFGAVRPETLHRLDWSDLNLEAQTLVINSKADKLRQRRVVELSANAVAWLRRFALKRSGPIVPENARRDFDAIKLALGYGTAEMERRLNKDKAKADRTKLQEWPQDVLRHTGISNHLAEHENEGKTASWAGNSPTEIHRSYKGLVTKAQAAEFWNIHPPSEKAGKIIRLG